MDIRLNQGFTLIELMLVIILLAVAATFAVPNFNEGVQNSRLTSQVNDASGLIGYSRSEASKLADGVVTVCSSTDQASCSGSANWETGWIVFEDVDGDRTIDAGDGDQLLRIGGALSGGNTMRLLDLTSDGGSFIQFASNGFPVPSATGNASGTLVICDDRGAPEARGVVLNVSGQTRLARDTGGTDGVLNDHEGNDLTCP